MADSSHLRPSLKGNVEEALRLFSSEGEWNGLNLAETEFVLEETLKCYGSTFDGDMIFSLFKFYRRYLGMSDVNRRQSLLTRMTEFIIDGHRERYVALLCFLSADTSDQIISGAALDLAMVVPDEPSNPLAGPKYVAQHRCGGIRQKLKTEASDDEGDAAAGLLLLGDMRLMPLLDEIWERLTPEGRRRMIKRRNNLASLLNVEFLLRRLEADKDEEYFGELGAALNNLPGIAAGQPINAILDIRRNFGLPEGQEPMALFGQETMAEAFARIRPRLEALIARESEPKVLPAVFSVWAKAAGSDAVPIKEGEDDEIEDDDADEYTEIASDVLHSEFESMKKIEGFNTSYEDFYFMDNPYETKEIDADKVFKEFSSKPVYALLVTGIFNPFGPTINVYLVQYDEVLDVLEVLLFRLNPFSCTKASLGLLDTETVKLKPGELDEEESERRRTFVMKERSAEALDGVHDYITQFVLARSKLQPTFTFCHSTNAVSPQKTLERLTAVYMATKNGRSDLNDFRDTQKRNDPWARADMGEAMKGMRKPGEVLEPLTASEAKQLATIVLTPGQQSIELISILQAWDGAIEFSKGLDAVLTREQLLKSLLFLTPDMPNLIKVNNAINSSDSKESNTSSPAPKIKETVSRTNPDYDGLVGCLYSFVLMEFVLSVFLLVWSLFTSQLTFALTMLVFALASVSKGLMMEFRKSFARWVAIVSYTGLWWFSGELLGPQSNTQPYPVLQSIISWWCIIFGALYLFCFDFSKKMREAPEVKQ